MHDKKCALDFIKQQIKLPEITNTTNTVEQIKEIAGKFSELKSGNWIMPCTNPNCQGYYVGLKQLTRLDKAKKRWYKDNSQSNDIYFQYINENSKWLKFLHKSQPKYYQ